MKKRKQTRAILDADKKQRKSEYNEFEALDIKKQHRIEGDINWWKKTIRQKICKQILFDLNLTDNHTLAYNVLVKDWLPNIIYKYGSIRTVFGNTKYNLKLSNYKFVTGNLKPSDAHTYNVSYSGRIFADIEQREICIDASAESVASGDSEFPFVKKHVIHRNMPICDFPIMLMTTPCHLTNGYGLEDQTESEYGGSFICKGKRRYIPMLKTLLNNYPFRFHKKNKYYFIQIRSQHLDRRHRSTSTLEVAVNEVKATRATAFHYVYVKIPFLNPIVPLHVLILALNWTADDFIATTKRIYSRLWDEVKFRKYIIMFEHMNGGCVSKDTALGYINKLYGKPETMTTAGNVMRSEILPHLNNCEDVEFAKGYYLAYIFGMLILFREGFLSETNRDSYEFTRVTDSSSSLALLFRMLFITFVKQGLKIMRRVLNQKKDINVSKIYNYVRLTQKIESAVATGTWSKKRKGVSHQMRTANDDAILANLRRISSSLNNDGKHITPRMVQADSLGYTCAAETPEGTGCGLIYAMALLTRVTLETDGDVLLQVFQLTLEENKNFVKFPCFEVQDHWYKFFDHNGCIIGYIKDIHKGIDSFCALRRSMSIDPLATYAVFGELMEFRIFCDMGRLVRPLLVIENLSKIPDIIDTIGPDSSLIPALLSSGCIEYVSAPMEHKHNFAEGFKPTYSFSEALRPYCEFTHLEITDVSFVGIIGALSPFFRHNQGPRLVYWIGMSKQAIWSTTKEDMGAATTHNLWYGQKRAVTTRTAKQLNMDLTPVGINCTVIFYALDYNQEDALIVNRASVDRGLFISTSTRTYDSHRKGTDSDISGERFENPKISGTFGRKLGSYEHLKKDGLPRPGADVTGGDIIIGKTVSIKKISNTAIVNASKQLRSADYQKNRRDKSVQVRRDEMGTVSEVILAHKGSTQSDIAKVRVRTLRIPETGDKLSSYHSQKGTIGRFENPENLPFSMKTGMVPDVVMTPLGFPSRMTMGKQLEMLLGKAVCLDCDIMAGIDDQLFDEPAEVQIQKVQEILRKYGYLDTGKEWFIDGISGQRIQIPVMCGIITYCKVRLFSFLFFCLN